MISSNLTWRWPWLMAILVIVTIAASLLTYWIAGKTRKPTNTLSNDQQGTAVVYSLAEDLETESAKTRYQTWHRLSRFGTLLLALILLIATLLSGRPSNVDHSQVNSRSRDIVLCLDVSGSTLPYDREVLKTYLDLVKNFQGERIALSIFNSTSRTVFPLTDDYELVHKQLTQANTILKGVQTQHDIDRMSDKQYQAISDWLEGTQNRKDTTSLIGDGLVACAAMLPGFTADPNKQGSQSASKTRSSSIVLATDNVASGKPTYTLEEALKLTHAANINVDGLYSGPRQSEQDESTLQMKDLIEAQGGVFLLQNKNDSISSLVTEIERRRGNDADHTEESNLVDTPGWWTLALCLLLGCYLLLVWRLQR